MAAEPDGAPADLGIAHFSDGTLSCFVHGFGRGNPTRAGGIDRVLGTPGFAAPRPIGRRARLDCSENPARLTSANPRIYINARVGGIWYHI